MTAQAYFSCDPRPAWSQQMTAAEAEKQFANFKFNGPGWYYYNKETILVVPLTRTKETLWHQKSPDEERFMFHVYNRECNNEFNAIVNAPTRVDDRD